MRSTGVEIVLSPSTRRHFLSLFCGKAEETHFELSVQIPKFLVETQVATAASVEVLTTDFLRTLT